jgi:hypothetical protein
LVSIQIYAGRFAEDENGVARKRPHGSPLTVEADFRNIGAVGRFLRDNYDEVKRLRLLFNFGLGITMHTQIALLDIKDFIRDLGELTRTCNLSVGVWYADGERYARTHAAREVRQQNTYQVIVGMLKELTFHALEDNNVGMHEPNTWMDIDDKWGYGPNIEIMTWLESSWEASSPETEAESVRELSIRDNEATGTATTSELSRESDIQRRLDM